MFESRRHPIKRPEPARPVPRQKTTSWCAIIAATLGGIFVLYGCEKTHPTRKMIDGLPISSSDVPPSVRAVQHLFITHMEGMRIVVPIVNRLGASSDRYPELTSPSVDVYRFAISDARTGAAQVNLTFRNASDVTINPIAAPELAAEVHSVSMAFVPDPLASFQIAADLLLTLETGGTPLSRKTVRGDGTVSGSGIHLNFSFSDPGAHATLQGFADGALTGSNPGASLNIAISFRDQTAGGSLTTGAQALGIHLEADGTGFFIDDTVRIFFQ